VSLNLCNWFTMVRYYYCVLQGGLTHHLVALCSIVYRSSPCDIELLRHCARGLSNFARFQSNSDTLVCLSSLVSIVVILPSDHAVFNVSLVSVMFVRQIFSYSVLQYFSTCCFWDRMGTWPIKDCADAIFSKNLLWTTQTNVWVTQRNWLVKQKLKE